MPIHDWNRVPGGIFHAFHNPWIADLQKALISSTRSLPRSATASRVCPLTSALFFAPTADSRPRTCHRRPRRLILTAGPPSHSPRSNPRRTEEARREYIPDHVRNFLDSVKSRRDPIEPVEVGHRTATICHLGNIAMRLKRKIRWDPDRERIMGDEEAAGLLSRPIRDPWHL